MKRFYFLSLIMAFAITASAQSLTFTPGTTATKDLVENSEVSIYIYIGNTFTSDFQLVWELSQNNLHPNWTVTVCDVGQCYFGVYNGDTMDVTAGQQVFLKPGITAHPGEMQTGSISYNVYVAGDRENTEQELTFIYTATVDVQEASDDTQISLYPNPVADVLHLASTSGKLNKGFVSIHDLSGAEILRQEVRGVQSADMDLSTLAAGSYLVRYESGKNIIMKKFIKTN